MVIQLNSRFFLSKIIKQFPVFRDLILVKFSKMYDFTFEIKCNAVLNCAHKLCIWKYFRIHTYYIFKLAALSLSFHCGYLHILIFTNQKQLSLHERLKAAITGFGGSTHIYYKSMVQRNIAKTLLRYGRPRAQIVKLYHLSERKILFWSRGELTRKYNAVWLLGAKSAYTTHIHTFVQHICWNIIEICDHIAIVI